MSFDLITMGRVGVDLYPLQSGVGLAEVETFSRSLGGSATNVAVATARYGHRTAVITKVGRDPFGDYVRSALAGFGVDHRFVGTHPELRTPVVFCELHPPDHFPILFYREPQAPDMTLTVEELDPKALGNARIVWTTGTGLSAEPSRSATLAAMDLATALVVHDLDHRPSLWDSAEEAGELARAAVRRASVVIGNLEECAVAVGEGAPEEMAARMIGLGAEVVLVKQGPKGVSAFGQDLDLEVPAVSVEVVNGLGAGDAFGGAVCHGLLEGWPWQETVAFANAAGAHVAARLACADAMPTEDEVRKLMAAHG